VTAVTEGLRGRVSLLDADPDLADALDEQQFELARRRAVAAVLELNPPSWDPTPIRLAAKDDWLGLFVIDGLMIRRVTVGRRAACELFGPGDLFRPWDADGEYAPLPISLDWKVLSPTRLAILDTAFALRMAPCTQVTSRIIGRVARRARYLALAQAATHLPRVHARLLILFWLLAERWGRVTREGVRVLLPLTHEVLAMLVGSGRPTVTLALQRLARAGWLTRERHDCWLLTHAAIERLNEPESLILVDDDEDDQSHDDDPTHLAPRAHVTS